MIDELISEFSKIPQIEAIALGGSRAGEIFDTRSDYDVYVYVDSPVSEAEREKILRRFCSYMEIGNHFWETEDNCILNEGIDIDLVYRDMNEFIAGIRRVVLDGIPGNGYTTCMWHNLITCRILYDRNGRLTDYQKEFTVPYPEKLKENIINRQLQLMNDSLPAYSLQLEKALKRGDLVSINHRVTEFLASYFDLIFAVNEQTHPGEKRLMTLCRRSCRKLPEDFEENLNLLFSHMFAGSQKWNFCMEDVERIVKNAKRLAGIDE